MSQVLRGPVVRLLAGLLFDGWLVMATQVSFEAG